MNLLTKILLSVIGILVIVCITFYIQNQILTQENIDKENKILVFNQNEQAYKDKLKQKADSIQQYALFVRTLQNENTKLKKEYTIIETRFNLLQDSLSVVNDSANGSMIGDTVTVKFNGHKNGYYYEGSTFYSLSNNSAWYNIFIKKDPVNIYNKIYLDETNKILKSLIYADGEIISDAITEIDSSIYVKLFGVQSNINSNLGFWDRLQLYVDFYGSNDVKMYKDINGYDLYLYTGIKYDFDDFTFYISKSILDQDIEFGVMYSQSIKQIVNKIF